jgi:hypothetical protein
MPYKWNDYVSVYVDPQSVKISETLRNRFVENFKANDELSLAVDQMKAALPFENDVKRKNELQQQINDTLDKLSERSDYENLGFAVHRASKDFAKGYSPIKENYEKYQAALTNLGEQYDKGQLNSEQYALAPSYMTRNYKGYEIDPTTGKVKAGSMFTAPTIYRDPKIMDLVTKRLEMLQMQKRGFQEGSMVTDENGTYKLKEGRYTEEIKDTDVMDVYNSVIQEPDVAAYLTQMADMKTFAADKSGQTQAVLQANQKQYQDEINKVQAAAAFETDEAKKATYQTRLAALQEASNKINAAMQDPGLASGMMREYYQEEILQPVKQYAMKKAGLFTYKEEAGVSGAGGSGTGTGGGKGISLVPLMQQDQVRADMDVSGVDHKSKMEYIATTDAQIATLSQELANADKNGYSMEIREDLQSGLNSLINTKSRVESQMKEAADSAISKAELVGQDPTLVNAMMKAYPSASHGQIYNMIISNPEAVRGAFEQSYGAGSYDQHLNQYYTATTAIGGPEVNAPTDYRGAEIAMSRGETPTQYERVPSSPDAVFRSKFEGKVDPRYAEIKESNLVNMGFIDTGMGNAMNMKTNSAIKEFFEKRPLMPEEQITIQLEDGTAKQVNGSSEEMQGYKIEEVGWIPRLNQWKVNFVKGEGEDAQVMTGYYDGSQIQSEGLTAVLNSPEIKFGSLVMDMKSSTPGVTTQIKTIKINGNPVIFNIYSRGDDSPYISITKPDGTPFLKSDIETGVATRHNLNEQIIKDLINSRDENDKNKKLIVTGY